MRKIFLLVALTACAHPQKPASAPPCNPATPADPELPRAQGTLLLRGGTVLTAAGQRYEHGYVFIENGVIQSVGQGNGPDSADTIINTEGKFITPGIIDTHSHMGVYPVPNVEPHEDGNEMSSPATPEIWAEHAFWPQDPSLPRALSGGITTIQVLPGSGNLIGGRSFTAKLHLQTSARQMRFPGAPQGLKIACGENPKRIHGKKTGPMTRMGNVAGYRKLFQKALEYKRTWEKYDRENKKSDLPVRDFALESIVQVLDGKILVQNHCYRADEMHLMLDLAREFGFKIRSFHHGLEAYKLKSRLHDEDVAVSTWDDWWGFKLESFDGIPQNAAMLSQAGVRTVIHSDSETEIRHLNQEAAKAMTAGKKVGITISENEVLRWITANPAWVLGIEDRTGTLEKGKMADVVVWDQHPFSTYAHAQLVFIDGKKEFDRSVPQHSDFEIGLFDQETP